MDKFDAGIVGFYPQPKPTKSKKPSKDEQWKWTRDELKKEFADAGITQCEIRLDDCQKDNFLGFAHTVKRGYVTDLKRVVLACYNCHTVVEYFSKERFGMSMEQYLEGIIAKRKGGLA